MDTPQRKLKINAPRQKVSRPQPPGVAPGTVLMLIDPESREAHRRGEPPTQSAPVFFTSRAALDAYAREHGLIHFEPYEVPSSVLQHMRGKPHWVDGVKQG